MFDSQIFGTSHLVAPAASSYDFGPLLETPRVLMRPLEATDAPEFYKLLNDWNICRKLPDVPFPYPEELASKWISAASADRAAGRSQQFALLSRPSHVFIGSAGLRLAQDGQSADLGYWIGRKYWRQGFGLEVASRLTRWGLAEMHIDKITASVAEDNVSSAALLRRAGFSETGKGKRAFLCRAGAKLPMLHFTATREILEQRPVAVEGSSIVLVAACALIDADGHILIARRPEGKKMAGLWEFPGGKINPGETPEAALVRELKEELDIDVEEKHLAPFAFASHAYDEFHLVMPLFLCRRWRGKPQPREGQVLAWAAPDRLVEYPMPAADRPLIPMLRDFL